MYLYITEKTYDIMQMKPILRYSVYILIQHFEMSHT